MVDQIGGSVSEILQLGIDGQRVGDETGEVFEIVRARADAFTADIEQMVQRLQQDVTEFADEVESRAAQLASTAAATNWMGRSGDAKRARLDDIHAAAGTFADRAMADVEEFRASLTSLVDSQYDHVARDMGAVVAEMQEVHRSEADHAANFARAARDLDLAAARG